jgi:hypothetical protein
MRRRVREHDVAYWAANFLRALDHIPAETGRDDADSAGY